MKTIIVKVGGKEYPTIIDKDGVQRFVENKLIRYLVDSKMIDLNNLSIQFQTSLSFTRREYAEFNMQLGYSVNGFADLEHFKSYKIDNPLWK